MNFIKMIWALTALMLPLQCLAQDYRKDKPQRSETVQCGGRQGLAGINRQL